MIQNRTMIYECTQIKSKILGYKQISIIVGDLNKIHMIVRGLINDYRTMLSWK